MYCNKCNINFQTQYAYINADKYISISKYIKNQEYLANEKIFCINHHELICVNGKKNKQHFRHKNSNDLDSSNPMTEWYCEWQSNFPITEVEFKKLCESQIKNRRADDLLNDNNVIEFQHSLMTKDEADNRINDYMIHNKHIIWIMDGNKGIKVNELKYSKRVYLEFISETWKFESFINCEYIYVNITDKIYKVSPTLIKSNMIDVQVPVSKDYFINCLKKWGGGTYYINIGTYLHALGDDLSPTENKCHVQLRLEVEDPSKVVAAALEWFQASGDVEKRRIIGRIRFKERAGV